MGALVAIHGDHGHWYAAARAVDHDDPVGRSPLSLPAPLLDARMPATPQQRAALYSITSGGALPSKLDPALRTHLHEHFGDQATLVPHRGPTVQPYTEPGLWFHDLPPLATIQGTIVAADAGTTPVGGNDHGACIRTCASATECPLGWGTSQEGKAMTLLLCVRWLAV